MQHTTSTDTAPSGASSSRITVQEYVDAYEPCVMFFIDDPATTFDRFHRFLDRTEQNFGRAATFRQDGTRVFDPVMIGWALERDEGDKFEIAPGGIPYRWFEADSHLREVA